MQKEIDREHLLDVLKEATQNWYKYQTKKDVLQPEEFFEEYEKVKDALWSNDMSDFLKDNSFTKTMCYANYLQVMFEKGGMTTASRPYLRLVH